MGHGVQPYFKDFVILLDANVLREFSLFETSNLKKILRILYTAKSEASHSL